MKYHAIAIVGLLAFAGDVILAAEVQQSPAAGAAGPRLIRTISRDWVFQYLPAADADNGHADAADDDASWPVVALPHTWQTYETTRELHPYIRSAAERDDAYWWVGWGWYRKRLGIDRSLAGRKIFLEFDGVQKFCRVFVNGQLAGEHKGGYASFSFDITKLVRLGEQNIIAVAVNNQRDDRFHIPPMSAGNFDVYGGIYRDVRLVITDPMHIPFQGSAEHEGGTFVTTPEVSERSAKVRVRTWVCNGHETRRECALTTIIRDPAGQIVQTLTARQSIAPGAVYEFDQAGDPIANPQLWSVESPRVYTVVSEVRDGERLADRYESPLGFRWFRWDKKEERLYLNDRPVDIHGTNRHQEYPWLGDAIPRWIMLRDLEDIRRNLNYNFMRTTHYTQDRFVYDYADRQGMLICEEAPNIKDRSFARAVQMQQVKEMIRRDRNHPSIIMWSMGNETSHAADSAWAVEEDKTRLIHARHVAGPSAGKFVDTTHENIEIEQLLKCTIRGWFNDDVKAISGGDQITGNEELQHARALASPSLRSHRVVTWVYADHGADREYAHCALKHVNPKGWVDSWRVPKYMYYLWQANYAAQPMVFVHPHFWTQRYRGQKRDFIVNSNCETVELIANGQSCGIQRPEPGNGFTVTFRDVPVSDGELAAIGRRNGASVAHRVAMAGAPAQLTLIASHERVEAGLNTVITVQADVTDAAGHAVLGAHPTLRWSVEGPAALVGPAVYESDFDKENAMEGTMYIVTPVGNVVRCTGQPGSIRVTVSADGLRPATATIEAVTPAAPPADGITETPIAPAGRRPVERIRQSAPAPQDGPTLIPDSPDDISLKGKKAKDFRDAVARLLQERNPNVDANGPAFRALVDKMAEHLGSHKGKMIRDDYNALVAEYNDAVRRVRNDASKPK